MLFLRPYPSQPLLTSLPHLGRLLFSFCTRRNVRYLSLCDWLVSLNIPVPHIPLRCQLNSSSSSEIYVFLFYVYQCVACIIYAYHVCVWYPSWPEEGVRVPGTRLTVMGCHMDIGNQPRGPLQEQPVLLTAELSLCP